MVIKKSFDRVARKMGKFTDKQLQLKLNGLVLEKKSSADKLDQVINCIEQEQE